jgi:hypothetical protein
MQEIAELMLFERLVFAGEYGVGGSFADRHRVDVHRLPVVR